MRFVLGSLVAMSLLLAGCAAEPPASGPTQTPTAVTSPSPSPTVSASPSPSPSVSASPTSSESLSPEEQYCADYRSILAEGDDLAGDDESMDLKKLAAWAAETAEKYRLASAHAPADLAPHYATLIQYLEDLKVTIDSGDQEAIIAQAQYLPQLNEARETIREKSEALCG